MRSAQPASGPTELWPEAKARAKEVRGRIENRPDEIPIDNNRQNLAAFRRNKDAHKAAGSAGDAGVPESVREVISSSGQSLDASIQHAVEDRMGDSFGDVQIHTGPQAAKACEDINARAFTVGNHIAFNSGEYDPESPEGQHLLAHELAHVRQQTGGALSMMPQQNVELEVDPDPQLEREAEETAQRVMEGGELGIQRMAKTEVHVQRSVKSVMSSVGSKLGLGGSDSEAQSRFQELNDGDLSETVGKLVENQREIMATLEPQHRTKTETIGAAAGKGAIGAVGGLAGAAIGTMIAPGVGTAGGAVAGQQLVTELASGVASDVSKAAYDPVFEAGSTALAEKSSAFGAYIEDLIDEKVRQRFGGSDHNDDTKF
ncbi:eCIS core domain-containing protein [Halovivax ruber]|nr:DUF4157 domain-containing protein [Halovivax ruber]